jgi:hypothetical protein
MKHTTIVILSVLVAGAVIVGIMRLFLGAGAFERHLKVSGVYAVCKPGGYDAVCFLDSDAKEGGLACLPLSAVTTGGKCR